ncbi:MAG: glycoside hydrolase family 31 protein [Acidobacteriia bacterium]|nr:glycoside hydrolase family 31 protein [Terriglobia bacterium]
MMMRIRNSRRATSLVALRLIQVLSLLLFLAVPASAQWQSVGNLKSVKREAERVTLNCENAEIQITSLAADLIRIRMTPGHVFGRDESWAVVKTDWPRIPVEISESGDKLRVATAEISVEVARAHCGITFRDKSGGIISQDDPGKGMGWEGKEVRVWKVMPADEYYYGLGEKAGPLEHNHQAFVNWNTDAYGYRWGTDPVYQTIPFLLALHGGRSYGIFFDNTYRSTFDLGKSRRDQYSFGAEAGELNYYFFYGPTPRKVIERYTDLTGRMPLPPRWALGYQQSRYSYEPESRVREIVKGFRQRGIPLDVIYLDIDYMDGYRIFTVDPKKFPHFREMISDFADLGIKVVTIIDPGIKQEPGYWVYDEGLKGNQFVTMPDGKPFVGNVWPGQCVFPDFTRGATRQWWGGLYKGLVDAGIKGFWNDMNEPAVFANTDDQTARTMPLDAVHDDNGQNSSHRKSHNVYGMLMARATFEGVMDLRPAERPFVLTRASYAGGQRYAAAWTGDNSSDWAHLHLWLPMTLNLGLSGQPFAGPDIGGFSGNPSAELYTRFMEAGTFSPFMREHSDKRTRDREPWSYGPEYEMINRRYIQTRYRLMPYIYSAFEEAARTGLPVMRPLFLEFPSDPRTYRMDTEYFFGPDLIVAPVLNEGGRRRSIYLPAGDWYNFWTGERLTGPADIIAEAPLDSVPLFARGGAIIPTQQILQYTDEAPIDPLTLDVFPGADSSGSLYEDDGLTYEYQHGKTARTHFHCRSTTQQIVFEMGNREGGYVPAPRSDLLKFNAVDGAPKGVQLEGRELPSVRSLGELRQRESGWTYDSVMKIAWVKFTDDPSAKTVVLVK